MKIRPFESLKIMLNCGVCGACPAVNINADGVGIGEDNNTVRALSTEVTADMAKPIKSQMRAARIER